MPFVEMGSPKQTFTVPGWTLTLPGAIAFQASCTYIGTTGTSAAMANRKGARLNGNKAPSGLRVPSGKTTAETPLRMVSAAAS